MQSSQCLMCDHYLGENECDAFPVGIPEEISSGEYDHTQPYSGDNGIQFEPIEPERAEQAAPQ